MSTVTLKGNVVETNGTLPAIGSKAPQFELVTNDLGIFSSKDLAGSKVILNIFPSIDTGICATSTRKFNQEASNLPNTKVICVSQDLPFALKRFCGAEGIQNVSTLSAFRSTFASDFGVKLTTGPLAGLCARSVIVLNEQGIVIYSELVPEITTEPNYEEALKAVAN